MTNDDDIVRLLGTAGIAFFGNFRGLREIQRRAILPIRSGRNILVASATASGKTEAILAPMIARTLEVAPKSVTKIRILVVAPTRALVNDLTTRIEGPLNRLDVACGRQTSDHRDKNKTPFVLVTTPESFDSMLVRDGRSHAGKVVDHLLGGVVSVFVDEAHLFEGTARGDQLSWLLSRLRRLRQLCVGRAAGGQPLSLQVCAGSATVSNPAALATRLLGTEAEVVQVKGTREVDVFGPSSVPGWISLNQSVEVRTLRSRLELVPSARFCGEATQRIWRALSSDRYAMRKALVFVPTRRLCDTFSTHLSGALSRKRDLKVFAHHGSLSQSLRERAERHFASARDAVLVATTTLEVGVDIGDIDLVALVGAPPNTRSLLQRIGRAGRRIGRTRVLALPRTPLEQAALASMLISARDGVLEQWEYGRRWSVFVQQAASFIAQARPLGRRRSDLLQLACDTWPERSVNSAEAIVEHLLSAEFLIEHRGRLALGEEWADNFDEGGRGMHANFDSSSGGTPVVDASTGEIVAHVAQPPTANSDLALGGHRWDVQEGGRGEILLKPKKAGSTQDGFQYAARSAPTGLEYAVHVRRGLGFGESDAPLLDSSYGLIWLHFGGSAFQALLRALVPKLRPISTLAGLAVAGDRIDGTLLAEIASQKAKLDRAVRNQFAALESTLSAGPYQRYLPDECRQRVVTDLIDVPAFRRWLESRQVWHLSRGDPRWSHVQAALLA